MFYCCCRLLFPLARPPPRLCFLCAFFLCLLESELFSFAAFLSTCLLPLDLPTMVNMSRRIIYKHNVYEYTCSHSFSFVCLYNKTTILNLAMFDCEITRVTFIDSGMAAQLRGIINEFIVLDARIIQILLNS